VPDGAHRYLIDTDVLIRSGVRKDAQSIYSGLIELAHTGRLRTVTQVFDELKKRGPIALQALKEYRHVIEIPTAEQYDAAVSKIIEELGNHKPPWLWSQTGGKNPDPADPWLVAVASVYGYTLVTNESQTSPVKIPAACRSLGARCIRGPHFLFEVEIVNVKEIKVEHIDPAAFFDENEGS
jgi:uncharacterized protein DUF4411